MTNILYSKNKTTKNSYEIKAPLVQTYAEPFYLANIYIYVCSGARKKHTTSLVAPTVFTNVSFFSSWYDKSIYIFTNLPQIDTRFFSPFSVSRYLHLSLFNAVEKS